MPPNVFVRITRAEWLVEGEKRFGPDRSQWLFVCPCCGHVQKSEDFIRFEGHGVPSDASYTQCIGRWDGHIRTPMGTKPGPCNYTSYGLINLNPIRVTTEDGRHHFVFAYAPAPTHTPAPPLEAVHA